jgi:hypothetical protein
MEVRRKTYWIGGAGIALLTAGLFLYQWYKFHNAIHYAIAPSVVIAISGNDYGTNLKKLHNLPLVGEIENDGSFELLVQDDFFKLEVSHAPGIKRIIKDKRMVLSFKTTPGNQLQSLLAVEAGPRVFESLQLELTGDSYTITSYKSPVGEIKEVYNALKQKELVMAYANGVVIITSEALFAEETLKAIRNHDACFNQVSLDFTSDHVYLKEAALRQWVDNFTKNNNAEFYSWFERIDECDLRLNEDGTLARARIYFDKGASLTGIRKERDTFKLEEWLQGISSTFVGFHPETDASEIRLGELYRCYLNLQDENISSGTFILARSENDSGSLRNIFLKHAIQQFTVLNKYKVFKFGKYPFFKNFCNAATSDLPESFIAPIAPNSFIVTSSMATMIPILTRISTNTPKEKESGKGYFIMQVQPRDLLPYFGKIVRDEYHDGILRSTFLQELDFVQYRIDSISTTGVNATVSFRRGAAETRNTAALVWSKILDHEAAKVSVLRGKEPGTNYILYQDAKSVLHCLDFSANEKWQKFILGTIEGKIFPVDAYQGGKTNFFFNSANQIYMLNERGEDMPNFPRSVYNEGIRGINLFFMGDRYEYYFTSGNLIYGFDIGGASLENWRPMESPVKLDHGILHFRKRNKNYIIGINGDGEILIWNRFGKRVEKDIEFDDELRGNFYITPALNGRYRQELLNIDTSGNIHSVTLDSLEKKEYRYTLYSGGNPHFVTQNTDSNFQKIIYQYRIMVVLFDRYRQSTDTISLPPKFSLKKVFDVDERISFIVLSDGRTSKVISPSKRTVADNIEGDILEIVADEIPNHYFIVTFDTLKRVNLYKFSM